jgi:16S rRNA C1402 N4-methylase RsmH
MADTVIKHYPVMASNLLRKMQMFPSILPLKIADCNFGLGGHSKLLLNHFPKAFMLVTIDTDKHSTLIQQSSTTSRNTIQTV